MICILLSQTLISFKIRLRWGNYYSVWSINIFLSFGDDIKYWFKVPFNHISPSSTIISSTKIDSNNKNMNNSNKEEKEININNIINNNISNKKINNILKQNKKKKKDKFYSYTAKKKKRKTHIKWIKIIKSNGLNI